MKMFMHAGRVGVRQEPAVLHLSQSQRLVSPDPEHRWARSTHAALVIIGCSKFLVRRILWRRQ